MQESFPRIFQSFCSAARLATVPRASMDINQLKKVLKLKEKPGTNDESSYRISKIKKLDRILKTISEN